MSADKVDNLIKYGQITVAVFTSLVVISFTIIFFVYEEEFAYSDLYQNTTAYGFLFMFIVMASVNMALFYEIRAKNKDIGTGG